MTHAFICPQCQRPIQSTERYCQYCGVDLVIEAPLLPLFPEIEVEGKETTLEPELLTPRLGETLLEQGKITVDQLRQALTYQKEQQALGRKIRLGRSLRELGILEEEAVDEAITLQILQLQTALKQANQQLEARVRERTEELRQALQRVGELHQIKANFIANVSHELRTPLTMLKGYLDMMVEGAFGPVTSEQAETLEALKRAEERLEKLIDDLILFAYAERGELTLSIAPARLEEILNANFKTYQYKAQVKQIELKLEITPPLPLVRCDREKISWVVGELLNNAVKFTPAGGWVKMRACAEDGLVTVSVEDSGIGIPPDRIEEIFEPFHQLDGSSTRRFGGTGLGLALLARIVEAHGSKVRVSSEEGEGACFSFSLPVIQTESRDQL
ncbi:MAG: ATP-binding protein [Chloroflexota bacterium]